jgi:cell division protein FtsL
MALVLAKNKRLQSSVTELEARLTRTCHREEDLKVKVLTLEKEHQVLEAENWSLTKQLSRSADQQKGMILGLALLILSIISCKLSYVDLETELDLFHEAIAQLQKEKEEVEEKTKRITTDLECKHIFS